MSAAFLHETLLIVILGSVISLIGGVMLLFLKKKSVMKFSHYCVSFSAGTLLGGAFIDLIPEAVPAGTSPFGLAIGLLTGIILFYIIESWFCWQHSHGEKREKPFRYLVILGDTIHNFIDGVVIAAASIIDFSLGVISAIAVFSHEIPQEIGDFGILLYAGFRRKSVFLINLFSACASLIGALAMFLASHYIQSYVPHIVSIAAGGFIYIATSDLLPELREITHKRRELIIHQILLFLGIGIMWFVSLLFE